MRKQIDALTAALLGGRVIEQVASRQGVKVAAIRALGMTARLSEGGRKVTTPNVAEWLDCNYFTALAGVNECVAMKWLERQDTKGWGLRLTLEGLRVVGLMERAEREARMKVAGAELPKWPRKYTRRKL